MNRTFLLCLLLWSALLLAQEAPVESVTAPPVMAQATFTVSDQPNDDGSALLLTWSPAGADTAFIERKTADGEWEPFTRVHAETAGALDNRDLAPGTTYAYRLTLFNAAGQPLAQAEAEAAPMAQWFNTSKISLLILCVLLSAAVIYYIISARRGKELFIRRIAGLDSMDEAVGRATEMGKPILFVPGINDIDDMQTIAGLTILGQLASMVAEHDTQILVPVCRSMVLSTAREVVKEAYLKAGRPDAYNPDSVVYLTDDQFGFVAGVDGIMVREKPAANFYLGAFYAEALILAETGFDSGAIQTAGTAMPSQLPFFVAACDYTLIGEELFAASAYLSRDPHQLGSLKGQDFGKALIVILLIIGVVQQIVGMHFLNLKDFLSVH